LNNWKVPTKRHLNAEAQIVAVNGPSILGSAPIDAADEETF